MKVWEVCKHTYDVLPNAAHYSCNRIKNSNGMLCDIHALLSCV